MAKSGKGRRRKSKKASKVNRKTDYPSRLEIQRRCRDVQRTWTGETELKRSSTAAGDEWTMPVFRSPIDETTGSLQEYLMDQDEEDRTVNEKPFDP